MVLRRIFAALRHLNSEGRLFKGPLPERVIDYVSVKLQHDRCARHINECVPHVASMPAAATQQRGRPTLPLLGAEVAACQSWHAPLHWPAHELPSCPPSVAPAAQPAAPCGPASCSQLPLLPKGSEQWSPWNRLGVAPLDELLTTYGTLAVYFSREFAGGPAALGPQFQASGQGGMHCVAVASRNTACTNWAAAEEARRGMAVTKLGPCPALKPCAPVQFESMLQPLLLLVLVCCRMLWPRR